MVYCYGERIFNKELYKKLYFVRNIIQYYII